MLPALVHSRVFVLRKADTVLLTLFDLREKREAFSISLDLGAHGFKKVVRAELVRGGGKVEPLPMPVMNGTVVTVNVPADAGKTAAVRMMVAR